MNLNYEDRQQLDSYIQGIAEILYRNTPTDNLNDLSDLELLLRELTLTEVSPTIAFFLSKKSREQTLEDQEN